MCANVICALKHKQLFYIFLSNVGHAVYVCVCQGMGRLVSRSSYWYDCYPCFDCHKLLNFQMASLSDKPVGYLIFLLCPNCFLLLINVALAFELNI